MNLPKVADTKPIIVEVEAGKIYSWCSCGLSQKQPFCDGAHKGTEFKSIKYSSDVNKTVSLCCCKASKNKPYCDGSHNNL